jgi:hypothetical protein
MPGYWHLLPGCIFLSQNSLSFKFYQMKKLLFVCLLLIGLGIGFTACSDNKQQKTEQLASDETYTCTMHNEVMSDHPGKCPKCNMNLVKQKMTHEQQKMKAEGTYTKPKE